MIWLRQSTASQEVPLGHFVDDTDGKTAETGLTIANTDIKVWKSGATSLANKNSGGATHISGGVYYAVLDATDTDTIGPLRLFVHVAGALPVKVDALVLDEAVFDVLLGTTALSTLTAAQVNAEVVDAVATDVIADSIPADGSRPTMAQALYMLTQFMTERAVSSTTLTVRKPDGSTTLMTFTLDDPTNPTSITRAS